MGSLRVVVVSGMSGAGRSTALHVLEDLGYFCVDNLPPAMVGGLVDLLDDDPEIRNVGLGIDVRTGAFLSEAAPALDRLAAAGHAVELVFCDCADDVLVRRFSETRRPHALGDGIDLGSAIRLERERIAPLRARATHVLDTTRFSVHDLRRALVERLDRGGKGPGMSVRVVSFGFKYGLPVDADLVFDLRYLPNPHFVPELRPGTGRDPAVRDYVLASDDAQSWLDEIVPVLRSWIPKYAREGKSYLTIAVGCTGGRHRSVAMAEALVARLSTQPPPTVLHRDVERAS